MHCLKMHGVASPKKQTMSMHAFILLQTKLLYVLLICEPLSVLSNKKVVQMLMFAPQKNIWKNNYI